MRQIAQNDICADKNTYTLRGDSGANLKKFCFYGNLSSEKIRGSASFSLNVPAGQQLNSFQFPVELKKESNLKTIIGVVVALVVILSMVLCVVCIVTKKKKRQLNTNVQPEPSTLQEGRTDDYHVYSTIDESLVYSHLLQKGVSDDVYESYEFRPEPKRGTICGKVGDDSTVSPFKPQQSQSHSNCYIEFTGGVSINDLQKDKQMNQNQNPSITLPQEAKGGNWGNGLIGVTDRLRLNIGLLQ